MKIEKEIVAIGNSKGIILPTLTLEFLDVKEGDILIIEDEEKRKGKFLAVYKKGNWNEMHQPKFSTNRYAMPKARLHLVEREREEVSGDC